MDDERMNYCCDCEYAVRIGLVFRKWHCTNREVNKRFGRQDVHPVTCRPIYKNPIDCDSVRGVGGTMAGSIFLRTRLPCRHYRDGLRGHPAIPPPPKSFPLPPPKKKGGAEDPTGMDNSGGGDAGN